MISRSSSPISGRPPRQPPSGTAFARAAVLASLLLAACARAGAAAAAATGPANDGAFLRELLALPTDGAGPAAAEKLIRDYLARRPRDANSLARWLRSESAYEPIDAGWHEQKLTVVGVPKPCEVPLTLHVPRSYRSGRPCPLILAAHGQEDNGRSMAYTVLQMLGADADKYIIAAPTMPVPRAFSGKDYQEQMLLQPLQWVRRRLNVDDDRICLTGYSLGGHCTWHLATMFPRLFAAAVAMAGTPWFEGSPATNTLYLENLSNLPFWSIWGELDKPPPPAIGQVQFNRAAAARLGELGNSLFRGTELPGVGHGGCWPPRGQFAPFLAAARRQPAPARFAHFFHLEHHRRGYYLEALQLAARPMRVDGPVRIRFEKRPGDTQGDQAIEDYFRRQLFKLWGDLDRQANELTIRTSRVRSARVYVSEGMFDLAQPVTLRYDGRTWKGPVRPSPECMLRHYFEDRDGSALVYNEIDITAAGRATVRYR